MGYFIVYYADDTGDIFKAENEREAIEKAKRKIKKEGIPKKYIDEYIKECIKETLESLEEGLCEGVTLKDFLAEIESISY